MQLKYLDYFDRYCKILINIGELDKVGLLEYDMDNATAEPVEH